MKQKAEFIEKWCPIEIVDDTTFRRSRRFLSDLDTLLKETEDRGIERGKIIERYGSETYFE